jgi:hypothetical protein
MVAWYAFFVISHRWQQLSESRGDVWNGFVHGVQICENNVLKKYNRA